MLIPVSAELRTIAIPFRFGFRHSLAERDVGDGLVLAIRDAEGRVGHGECAPRDYVSGETASSVVDALGRLVPRWLGRSFDSFDALVDALASESAGIDRGQRAAWCALELAWLDLGGRVFGRSAGEPLGRVCRQRIEYSGVVSAAGKKEAAATAARMKELGVTQAKVKVGGQRADDLAVLGAVREALGASARLRVDANAAWDADTALSRLRDFEPFRLEACEQPCAADDLDGMAAVAAGSPVPIVADESLVTLEDARALAERRACDVFNVRISKCGGLLGAKAIRELAIAAGIDTMLGAHVGETAILAAAGRQYAARTAGLRFAEGSYGKLLLEDDVSDDLDLGPGGIGTVSMDETDGASGGLGLEVALERIAPHVTSRVELRS